MSAPTSSFEQFYLLLEDALDRPLTPAEVDAALLLVPSTGVPGPPWADPAEG